MKDIFEFNHTDSSLAESDIEILKDFYRHYHKKYWCFKKAYKRYKRLVDVLTIFGAGLIVIGTIIGGVTLNPIILGIINGAGVKKWKCHESLIRHMAKYSLNCDLL